MPYFETKHKTVFSPGNKELDPFYNALEKYAPVLGDSRVFEDLIEVYEALNESLGESYEPRDR